MGDRLSRESCFKVVSFPHASGIRMHPTSLPGPYGIGDLGQAAYRFIDLLFESGQTYWQVLPLGPTAYADSPYQCLSSFAGNTNLISLDALQSSGWLKPDELDDRPAFEEHGVDYPQVIAWHDEMLTRAYRRCLGDPSRLEYAAFRAWCAASSVQQWL